ncbi:glycosyltransferase [Echinicola jeungdonensis]|uniref:Glycosyltransferase n=1 Tax=Echinicola jeungdonensis TaxID=709343 RepID=A0ABV5J4N6_9BACT|nr:glycosyltransferase [Echinicola jeungdonensis]MDN3667877.1 glycosyltransferase [Echinicola jeungdonensis]
MKILFFGNDASRSGAPISLLTLIQGIKNIEPQWEITVILLSGGPILEKYSQNVKTLIYTPPPKSKYLRFRKLFIKANNEVSDLPAFINNYKPELIYINTIVPIPFLIPIKFNCKVKLICHIREMEMVSSQFLKGREKKYFKEIDHFFVVNSRIEKDLVKRFGVDKNKTTVAPGPFDLYAYPSKQIVKKESKFNIAMAGTPTFRKGIDISIHLASLMKDKNVCFHWFGEISNDKLIELEFEICKRNIDGTFKLIGNVDDVYSRFFEMNAFFMSSREDPFPRVAIEAALAELPIIYFKQLTGVEDFLNNDSLDLGIDYLDYNSIISIINNLSKDEVLRRDIGRRNRIEAIDYLNRIDTVLQVRNCILKLIEGN